jgi:hypothetical protein
VLAAKRAEVSAVETVWVVGEDEDLAGRETVATMPDWHVPMTPVAGKGASAEGSIHEDALTEPAHQIASDPNDELDQVRRLGQVSALVGQFGETRWQPDKHEVATMD